MKITDVRSYCIYANFRNWVFIRIDTDEGIHGFGEGTTEFLAHAVEGCIADLKHFFIGRDPRNIEDLIYTVQRTGYYRGAVLSSALSAYEQAMWDILGKSLGVPVWQLLGGKVRDKISVYGNGWRRNAQTIEDFVRYAKDAAAEGWKALKWDPFDCAAQVLDGDSMTQVENQVAAVREAVGPGIQLLIEGHGRFKPASAIEIARMLEPYGVYYFEEPVPSYDAAGMAEVRKHSNIRIAGGERVNTLQEFKDLFTAGAVDIVQPDIIHAGGLLNIRKIASMAEAFGVMVAPHNCNGPVCAAATLHADAGIHNLDWQEMFTTDAPWRPAMSDENLVLENGFEMAVPEKPGLGIELNEEAFAEYPPQDIRDFLFFPEYYRDNTIKREGFVETDKA